MVTMQLELKYCVIQTVLFETVSNQRNSIAYILCTQTLFGSVFIFCKTKVMTYHKFSSFKYTLT